MPRVSFTPNLQRYAPSPALDVRAATLREALNAAFAENPLLRSYVLDDQGRLRKHIKIFINAEALRDASDLAIPIGPQDDIFVFQALSGG